MALHKINVSGAIEISGTVLARRSHNFSSSHLRSAREFAAQAAEFERSRPAAVADAHRPAVIAAIVFSAAFVEAAINALFLGAIDNDTTAIPGLDKALSEKFARQWTDWERRTIPILAKYQAALDILGKTQLDVNGVAYQDAQTLVYLRNALVHYAREWDDEQGRHHTLESRLAGRFTTNPYAPQGVLWFPHQCLGAGCAGWSLQTAEAFFSEFALRSALPNRFFNTHREGAGP